SARSRAVTSEASSIGQSVTHNAVGPQALTRLRSPDKGRGRTVDESGGRATPNDGAYAADRPPPRQRHSRSRDGRGRGRPQRTPGDADGHGRRRNRAIHAASEV